MKRKTGSFINMEVVGGKMFNNPSKDKTRQNSHNLLNKKLLHRAICLSEAKSALMDFRRL